MKRPGIDERIKNTMDLLKTFAEENLTEEEAKEIKSILGEDDKDDENKKNTP